MLHIKLILMQLIADKDDLNSAIDGLNSDIDGLNSDIDGLNSQLAA